MNRGLALAIAVLLTAAADEASAQVRYIDTHAHVFGFGRDRSDYAAQIAAALATMDKLGIARTIIAAPPQSPGLKWRQDSEELLKAVGTHPDRFAVEAGAGSLNIMILEAVRDGRTSDALRRKFVARAEELAHTPIVAFGEMAADHFSQADWHPYEHAPPDHPLFLELADIAAKYDLPIDLHMEAIEHPAELGAMHGSKKKGSRNPATLTPNIPGLERLLAHNPKTRIIWTHVGWDNTGQRTPELTKRLLAAHPNLYVAIKLAPGAPAHPPFFKRGQGVAPDWRAVIDAFPDRFMVGSDEFYFPANADRRGSPQHPGAVRIILNSLPPDLAQRIGVDNPLKVYPRLGR